MRCPDQQRRWTSNRGQASGTERMGFMLFRPRRTRHRTGRQDRPSDLCARYHGRMLRRTSLHGLGPGLALFLIGCGGTGEDTTSSDTQARVAIACGAVTCDQICCPLSESCAEEVDTCLDPTNGHGVYMKCDGPEDCSDGETCCIGVGAAFFGSAECTAASECSESFQQIACHGGGDCPTGTICQPAASADIFVPTLLSCQ